MYNMPRNFSKYQYETSPRKFEPEYTPRKNPYKSKKNTTQKQAITKKKEQDKLNKAKQQKTKIIKYVIIGFIILFGICYRSSQIDEQFAKVQSVKEELGEMEKQNAQLKVLIQNGLNLNNLEQQAKELLGMQKLNSKQTVYIDLPNDDYIESATEEVIIEENNSGLKGIINTIANIFK